MKQIINVEQLKLMRLRDKNNNMTNMDEDDPKDAIPVTNQNNKDKHFQDDKL